MRDNIRLPLGNAANVRDLGGYPAREGSVTKFHVFLRGDRLDFLDEQDLKTLYAYGVRSVLDLRSDYECAHMPDTAVQKCGLFHYVHFSLMEEMEFERSVSIDPENIPQEAGAFLYQSLVADSRKLAELVQELAHLEGAVLFHCTGGQDRTGVTAMILLMLAGVSREDILADYAVSSTYLQRSRHLLAGMPIHIDVSDLYTDPANLESAYSYILSHYGSVENCLRQGGAAEEIEQIRQRFLQPLTPEADCVHLPMCHAFNVRDLGGHPAGEGKTTAFHRYVRSSDVSALDQKDLDFLYGYGVRHVVDLRSPQERLRRPDAFLKDERFQVHYFPFPKDIPDAEADATRVRTENAEAYLPMFYAGIACRQRLCRSLLVLLAGFSGGVLFHCTAGKDRTGLAAMLILLECGVPEADILADYQVTEQYLMEQPMFRKAAGDPKVRPLLRSRVQTMQGTLDAVKKKFGSRDDYLAALRLTPAQTAFLEADFLNSSEAG